MSAPSVPHDYVGDKPAPKPIRTGPNPLRKTLKALASLRLTVVLFALSMALVFLGTVGMTQDSIGELRGYVRVLGGRPRDRGDGFVPALRRQIERFQSFYGLKVDLELRCANAPTGQLADEVLQMVAESLSNIGRHTASRQVAIKSPSATSATSSVSTSGVLVTTMLFWPAWAAATWS